VMVVRVSSAAPAEHADPVQLDVAQLETCVSRHTDVDAGVGEPPLEYPIELALS